MYHIVANISQRQTGSLRTVTKMGLNKYFVLCVVLVCLGYCLGEVLEGVRNDDEVQKRRLTPECPSGEYNPGPDCNFEVICGRRSAHSSRRHYCDCWCNPGLFRDTETNACVETCP